MKKFILGATIAVASLFASPAVAAAYKPQWVMTSTSDDGQERFYYDAGYVRRVGGFTYTAIWMAEADGRDNIATLEIDCSDWSYRITAEKAWDAYDRPAGTFGAQAWTFASDGQNITEILKRVCR